MSQLDELTDRMKKAVGTDSGLGKTLKFNLKGDGFIYLDSGVVTNEDKPAELTLTRRRRTHLRSRAPASRAP